MYNGEAKESETKDHQKVPPTREEVGCGFCTEGRDGKSSAVRAAGLFGLYQAQKCDS
jgi:hypothetical protein